MLLVLGNSVLPMSRNGFFTITRGIRGFWYGPKIHKNSLYYGNSYMIGCYVRQYLVAVFWRFGEEELAS